MIASKSGRTTGPLKPGNDMAASKGGRTLPAVPVLQQKPKEDAAMQMQEDGSAPSAVIQMRHGLSKPGGRRH